MPHLRAVINLLIFSYLSRTKKKGIENNKRRFFLERKREEEKEGTIIGQ